jgi:hypothetical protein
MSNEVQRHRAPQRTYRSAQVIDAKPIPRERWETIIGDSRARVLSEVHRGIRRGEYAQCRNVRQYDTGTCMADVLRVRPPVPRWVRPAIIAGCVLATLSALGLVAVWALSAIGDALAGKWSSILVGAAIGMIGIALFRFRRPVTEVIVRVR